MTSPSTDFQNCFWQTHSKIDLAIQGKDERCRLHRPVARRTGSKTRMDLFELTAVQLVLAMKTILKHNTRVVISLQVKYWVPISWMQVRKRVYDASSRLASVSDKVAFGSVALLEGRSHAATLWSGLVPQLMKSSTFKSSNSNDFSSLICNEVSNCTWLINSLDLHFYLHIMNICHGLRGFFCIMCPNVTHK